jgi:teichuronic acid exporter
LSFAAQIFKGVVWTTIQTVINRSFGFVIKLFLARILFPEDYGLVGMAIVFTSFVQVFNDLGMGAALVQRKDEKLREEHYHTAFWTGVVWSFLIYLIISLAVAPFAAWFYNEPLLRQIIPVLSIGVLAGPVNLVHKAQLTKALDFKKLAIISNSSSIFSGLLSLGLAFYGAGVWALVFNSVSTFIIAMPLYYKATGWRPKWVWQKQCFKDIFGFGIYTTGTQLFNKITSQIDYLLVGKLLGATSLGIYSFAFILTDAFRGQMMAIINQVMYPVYAKMQDDKKKLNQYYYHVVRYNAILIYPFMFLLIFYADNFVPLLFGDKWMEAILPIKLLAISVLFHMLVNSNTSLIRGMGRPGLEMKLQMIKSLVFFVPCISIGTYFFGLIGTATGYLIAKVLTVAFSLYIMRGLLNMDIKKLLVGVSLPFIISLSTGILTYYLHLKYLTPIVAIGLYFLLVILLNYYFFNHDVKKIRQLAYGTKKEFKAISNLK